MKPEEIAAIYITPCQAKSHLHPPAGGRGEELSRRRGGHIRDLQRASDEDAKATSRPGDTPKDLVTAGELLHWGAPEGEFPKLSREHYLPLTGLTDIMKVFDDIEKGRLRNIEFLECHACQGGCVGGNLTVENLYVARSKDLHLMASMPNEILAAARKSDAKSGASDAAQPAPC